MTILRHWIGDPGPKYKWQLEIHSGEGKLNSGWNIFVLSTTKVHLERLAKIMRGKSPGVLVRVAKHIFIKAG